VRPIEIIVPSTPGGGLDVTGRPCSACSSRGNTPISRPPSVNKPGGSGTIGIAYMNQRRPDGQPDLGPVAAAPHQQHHRDEPDSASRT